MTMSEDYKYRKNSVYSVVKQKTTIMEIDYRKLEEIGITNNGKKKQFCPECHANRTDQCDKLLSVDWDKCIAHCHYCGKSFFFGKTLKLNDGQPPKYDP